MRTTRIGGAALAGVILAGCGEETTITVHASGATLVAIDVGGGWEVRPAGDVTFVEPDGPYRFAVTCRSDIGDTRVTWAAPGDETEHDRDCFAPLAGGVEVTFDVTGDVYGMFIGGEATYGDETTVQIAPGTYDVVATRTDDRYHTNRVQVIRDVVVEGPTRIAIDVGALGVPLEPVELVPADAIDHQQVWGYTARRTWFQLYADPPLRIPAALGVDGDEHWMRAVRFSRTTETGRTPMAEGLLAVGAGPVDVTLPASDEIATFTAGPPSVLAWSSVEAWESAGFRVAQDNEYSVPSWYVSASRRALDLGAELSFPDPPPGWRPSWTVDVGAYYWWSGNVSRARADGGWERIVQGGGVFDPAPPPRLRDEADQQPFRALRMMSSMRP